MTDVQRVKQALLSAMREFEAAAEAIDAQVDWQRVLQRHADAQEHQAIVSVKKESDDDSEADIDAYSDTSSSSLVRQTLHRRAGNANCGEASVSSSRFGSAILARHSGLVIITGRSIKSFSSSSVRSKTGAEEVIQGTRTVL
ncbi:hypothetical protein OC834_007524 [Tilletia horrida]|nr:hypothetical protein OC834_007524 [Tilletia horrida]